MPDQYTSSAQGRLYTRYMTLGSTGDALGLINFGLFVKLMWLGFPSFPVIDQVRSTRITRPGIIFTTT